MKRPFVACIASLAFFFVTGAGAQHKVRIGYPVQIHTSNVLLMQENAKKHGVEVDGTVMRGYPVIQLALTGNQIDMVVLGYANLGLMEEKEFRNHKVVAGVFTGGQCLTLRNGVTART